jgi:hypothetical protein
VGRVTRLQSSLYATARSLASPSPAKTFTIELSPDGSPRSDVDYNYAANNQLPQPDFHRQDTRPYGLRTKARKEENTKEKKNFVLSKFRVFVINHFGFPDKSGFTLRSNRLVRVG